MDFKPCNICHVSKDTTEFPKHPYGKFGVTRRCKICTSIAKKLYRSRPEVKEATRKYEQRTQEKTNLYYKKWNSTDIGKASRRLTNRKAKLKFSYNMTLEEFNRMLETQKYSCALCGNTFSTNTKHIHVDHSHKTKKIRALLCSYCNPGLGNFKDSINLLERAIEYLRRHQ
jgi:hypothetical protein